VHTDERLFNRHHRLCGSMLFGGHWGSDRLAQLALHMKEVGRMMHL